MKEHKKKVVFITGAAKNTGYAIAEKFASEGYDVCISGRNIDSIKDAASKLSTKYPSATIEGYQMSINNIDSIRNVFNSINERFERLDVFVPNAATLGLNQSILNTTPEEFDEVMEINLKGYFFTSQEAARLMVKRKKGSIVMISSVQQKGAIPNRIVYSASKGGVASMMKCMAYELAAYGIRVNTVSPGAIWSDRWKNQTAEESERRRANYPAGRESMPSDIANAVFFMASEQAPTITGTDLLVDSGVLLSILPYDKDWDNE